MTSRAETLRTLTSLSGFADVAFAPSRPRFVDEEVAVAAFAEQVAPLLGARLVSGELAAGPSVRSRLVGAHLACVATEAWAAQTRAPLLAALRSRGVPTMLLKGGALVRVAYGAPGQRVMADLDLLVPAARWRDAQAALRSAGATAAPVRAIVARLPLYHERSYRVDGGAWVDLHRTLTAWPLFRVDHDALFARARLLDDGLLVPAAEDLFVSLVVHAAQDGFCLPLRTVIDGLALAASGMMNADLLVERARAWHAARATAIWLNVLLAHGLATSPWAEVAAVLGGRVAARAASTLPHPVPRDRRDGRWQARWQLVRAHDAPVRPLAFLAYRAAFRLGDLILSARGAATPSIVLEPRRD
jgi:hypothetical protein